MCFYIESVNYKKTQALKSIYLLFKISLTLSNVRRGT